MPIVKQRVLLLTKKIDSRPMGGREMLCKLNHDILKEIFGDQLLVFELISKDMKSKYQKLNTLRGHFDGLSARTIDQTLRIVKDKNVSKVFIDGSNLGGVVPHLKRNFPEIEVIIFYHNVEARFFWGAFKTNQTIRALAVLVANYLSERKATRLSNKRICLLERDSKILQTLYGKGATHISPIAIVDGPIIHETELQISSKMPFILFVGGNFYANVIGIAWFVKHVVPRISIKICIVGKGMEKMRSDLEIPGRVEVIGPVESLTEWYRNALFVIAPIFDGSGMKTKVAEAIMHGKKVVGTPEAFSGYENARQLGWVCRTVDDFVTAIAAAESEIITSFDVGLREIFLRRYSFEAAKKRLEQVLL